MKEKIVKLLRSRRKGKKYKAIVSNGEKQRVIHFGASSYGQFRDSTSLRAFAKQDHGDRERRARYFLRHSGVRSKREAIAKEVRKSRGKLNARILSHRYLW